MVLGVRFVWIFVSYFGRLLRSGFIVYLGLSVVLPNWIVSL